MEIKIKQETGLHRNVVDKYYTTSNVVELCLHLVCKYIHIDTDNDLMIEPSAGNGSFIAGIKSFACRSVFYDIEPENAEIVKQDYLYYDYHDNEHEYARENEDGKIHVVGNPPFGRQSSMAIKFIKKSCEFCDNVAFILPKSFKKESLKRAFPLHFHLIAEIDLPEKSFLVGGIEHDVPCIFQIWEKKTYDRFVPEKQEPLHFVFIKKTENPDISVRRVGVNAGSIYTNIDDKSIQSHYFISFTNGKSTNENMIRLSSINYEFDNTVGPKSISKQELIRKFNPLL
jgi:predicted RNA methylase